MNIYSVLVNQLVLVFFYLDKKQNLRSWDITTEDGKKAIPLFEKIIPHLIQLQSLNNDDSLTEPLVYSFLFFEKHKETHQKLISGFNQTIRALPFNMGWILYKDFLSKSQSNEVKSALYTVESIIILQLSSLNTSANQHEDTQEHLTSFHEWIKKNKEKFPVTPEQLERLCARAETDFKTRFAQLEKRIFQSNV